LWQLCLNTRSSLLSQRDVFSTTCCGTDVVRAGDAPLDSTTAASAHKDNRAVLAADVNVNKLLDLIVYHIYRIAV